VQIVVAGKAHPADEAGKAMIQQWIAFANQPRFRHRVVFLEDYDLALAQELVRGVDVWINTPRRPWEACGTSGMKVLVNGGLNCSVLDGWWGEAYQPDLGWRIGKDVDSDGADGDAADAEDSYAVIERHIAPEFYQRDETGLPRGWVARIRRSMAALTPAFSSARMMSQYVEGAYLPAAAALRARQADGFAQAKQLAARAGRLARAWPDLHVGAPSVTQAGGHWRFAAPVFLGEIAPDEVRVELYADPAGDGRADAIELARAQPITGALNGYVYAGDAPSSRPAGDYTVRVTPARPSGGGAAELPLIAWQA
jgi:starch phosphorylase